MIGIYQFSRAHLAKCLFGDTNPGALRRIDALLDGESRMTVDILYTLYKIEPLLDLEKSLSDLYARYELANYKKNIKKMGKRNKKSIEFMSQREVEEGREARKTKALKEVEDLDWKDEDEFDIEDFVEDEDHPAPQTPPPPVFSI